MFHILNSLTIFFFSLRYGKWKRWREFQPAYVYWSLFSFYYAYTSVYFDRNLWVYTKTPFNLFLTENLYVFFLYPSLLVMFLGNLPDTRIKTALYIGKWGLLSFIIETFQLYLGYIQYHNGWNLFWNFFFYVCMYTMISLYYRKPVRTLLLSPLIALFFLIAFDYPFL